MLEMQRDRADENDGLGNSGDEVKWGKRNGWKE